MIAAPLRRGLVALALLAAVRASGAQGTASVPPASARDSVGPARATARAFLLNAFGPLPIARSAGVAALDQWRREPLGWPRDARSYADRFGIRFGGEALAGTFRFGLRRALHEQKAPFTFCACSGRVPRARHALALPFRAFPDGGGYAHPSVLTPLSELGSGVLRTTFQPGGMRVRDGLLAGAGALAGQAGVSALQELWPWPWRVADRLERAARARLPRRFRGTAHANGPPPDGVGDPPCGGSLMLPCRH